MGRKAGGKNFGNFIQSEVPQTEITETENAKLSDIFTCIEKDLISVQDFMSSTGLSYDTCAKIIRQIKSISDVFGISGYVHRIDYFIYISRKFTINKPIGGVACTESVKIV